MTRPRTLHIQRIQATGCSSSRNYLIGDPQELRDLFSLDPAKLEASATQAQLHALHGQRRASPVLSAHLDALARLPAVTGVSHHDLLFSEKGVAETAGAAGIRMFQAPPSPAGASAARRRMAAGSAQLFLKQTSVMQLLWKLSSCACMIVQKSAKTWHVQARLFSAPEGQLNW